MMYKVVKITNNIKDYPECKKDSEQYPEIVQDVEDEDGQYCLATDFFHMTDVKTFKTWS